MKDRFVYLLRVRYAECDPQGIVFNGRYVDYVDVAMTEFSRALFGGYDRLVARGLDHRVVALELQWHGPAHFDDVLQIGVQTERVGTTSYVLGYDLGHWPGGAPVATATATYVMVETDAYAKTPVPDDVRTTLLAGAPGVAVDHAGALGPGGSR